jgi:RNA polymerase sigma-70 factor (sigma-E family)
VSVGGDHRLSDPYADAAGAALRAAGHSADASHIPVVLPHVPHARGTEPADHVNGSVTHANGAADQANGSGGHANGSGHASAPAGPRPAGIDDLSFRDYVHARSRALLRTAYMLTGNRADAEDLVQAALAKTYLAWDRIEDRGAVDGYVRRAMVNTHISWWRRRRIEEFPTDEIPDQAIADHSVSNDMQESLRHAIDRLPQRMRAAVMLRYYEDMTEAEVAEVLGVSLGTVKSTVSRAVAKLRIDAELRPE